MSEILREQAQWRIGKTPIIGKYIGEHKKLFDEIAGRGFLNLPGYAYDAENQLELAAKMGLSELNYKIMHETIERELKQAGIDFNVEYAEAAMAWELEKQGLLSAWDHELAEIKQGMATEEEVLARLALEVDARQAVLIAEKNAIDLEMEGYRKALVEVDARQAVLIAEKNAIDLEMEGYRKGLVEVDARQAVLIAAKNAIDLEMEGYRKALVDLDAQQAVLITAKSAIDLEMEGYRKALADLDAATAPYEVQLASAKLLAAQKKLELLPIIEEIIVKEGELIVLEAEKTDYFRQLMDAEKEVAEKKQTLVPGLTQLATAIQRHTALIPTQIATEQAIAEEKTAQAKAKKEIADNDVERMNKEIETATKDIEINEAKRDLADKKFDNEQELIAIETDKETEYQDHLNGSFDTVQDDERDTQSKIIANKETIHSTVNETRKGSANRITGAQKDAEASSTAADIHRMRGVADAQAAAKITASLTHLIG